MGMVPGEPVGVLEVIKIEENEIYGDHLSFGTNLRDKLEFLNNNSWISSLRSKL